nr:reverse transcriptase zinc-binding domain-containing protein [Tanacetum cinerariifolium]
MKKGKAKVAWDPVCMPKHEGGLGIRIIDDFNVSLMATHIWSILTHRESLCVKWVHTYKLKGRSFWDVPCRGDVPLLLNDIDDLILWRDRDGDLRPFSVWSKVRVVCGMDSIPPQLIDVTTFIIPISKGKTTISIISRLVLAATSYYYSRRRLCLRIRLLM